MLILEFQASFFLLSLSHDTILLECYFSLPNIYEMKSMNRAFELLGSNYAQIKCIQKKTKEMGGLFLKVTCS